jgi:hypothetical protein
MTGVARTCKGEWIGNSPYQEPGEISEDKKMRIKEETKVEGQYKGWEEGKG